MEFWPVESRWTVVIGADGVIETVHFALSLLRGQEIKYLVAVNRCYE